MMRPKMHLFLILSLFPLSAMTQESEITRLRGFAQHQKQDKQFDKARQSGERAFLEQEEQWESARKKAIAQYSKEQKQNEMTDEGPEARADAAAKEVLVREYEKVREAYAKSHKEFDRSNYPDLVNEMTELGLDQERPRYDYRKRAMFGASGTSSSSSGKSSTPGSRFGGGSNGGGGGSSFPPPPTTFDDFSDGGYPAPNQDDFGDVPPPPPPPPFPGDDYPGGGFNNDDYIPPPPPPFDGEIETQF